MTDYLELTWPGQEDALLEQARRLERALSRLIAGGQPKPEGPGEESRSRARERPAGARTEGVGEAEAELLSPDGSRRRTPGPRLERMDPDAPGPGRAEGEGDPERESLPLETQLTRLDRAVRWADGSIRSGGMEPGRSARPAPRRPGGGAGAGSASGRALPGEGWEPDWGRAAAGEGGLPYGRGGPGAWEETRWAEQADRVFRRDSRRYDGGFYLY